MSDLMLTGVLAMPYEMAMSTELGRRQYWDRAQQALERIAELEREVIEQARLLGISGSAEARLLARVAELERALLVARGALSPIARIGAISAYIIANARTAVDGIDAVMRKERDDAPR